jgi:Pretoxin HINT domain
MSDKRQQEEERLRKQKEADARAREKEERYNKDIRDREKASMERARKERERTAAAVTGKKPCFVGSTPILTPEGWRPISDLSEGDKVISYDQSTDITTIRCIERRKDHKPAIIWEVHLMQREEPICTTKSHSFLTNRGWQRTNQLRTGDIMITVGGDEATVVSVGKTSRAEPVFNLITEGEHTYIAQGCVAHNFTYLRNIRVLWSKYISIKSFSREIEPHGSIEPNAMPMIMGK